MKKIPTLITASHRVMKIPSLMTPKLSKKSTHKYPVNFQSQNNENTQSYDTCHEILGHKISTINKIPITPTNDSYYCQKITIQVHTLSYKIHAKIAGLLTKIVKIPSPIMTETN